MPAPSWPRMAGNRPSGSAPDKVKASVCQTPVALISTSTSPALGPSRSTVSMTSGLPASNATAALVFTSTLQDLDQGADISGLEPYSLDGGGYFGFASAGGASDGLLVVPGGGLVIAGSTSGTAFAIFG